MVKNKSNANCNQVILDHFWHICDASEVKRVKSIQTILQTLAHQVANSQNTDIDYCLHRLIKGLVSAREFSRHGFCVLLTQILAKFPENVHLNQVIEMSESEYGKEMKNANPESAISWALLIGCLLKSESINIRTDEQILSQIFDILCTLGTKKNYVEIMVCSLLGLFFDIFHANASVFEKIVVTRISEEDGGLFSIYLVLLAYQKFPSATKSLFDRVMSERVYKSNSKDYGKAIGVVKETTKYHPNIHPINELLIQTITSYEPKNAEAFFSKTVEEIFKVNLEKTFLGFDIVCTLLKYCDEHQVSTVLSPNFMRIFIQTLSNKKHPLHNKATELGESMVRYSAEIRDRPCLQVAFGKCFVQKPGSINFDELSKSKILSGILRNFTNEPMREWVRMLKCTMQEEENVPASDFYRIRCLQQMTHLLRAYTDNDHFVQSLCRFLFVYSYFDASAVKNFELASDLLLGHFKCPLSEKLQRNFADSFKTILAHVSHLAALDANSPSGKLAKQITVLTLFVDFVKLFVARKKIVLLQNDAGRLENIKGLLASTLDSVQRIDQLESASVEGNVFKFLYFHLMIESFENGEEISALLPDLDECANRALFVKKKSKNGPVWADVLTDLFLSLLATKSKHTKNVIYTAFRHVSPFLTLAGVDSLTGAVLNTDAFDMQDSDEEMEDEEQGDEPMEEDSSSSEDDLIEQDEEEEVEVDEQFKNDIIRTLGNAAAAGDDSDEPVSDSEMMKLDDSLAEIFRKKFGDKKRENEKQNTIQIFKHRALELLGIWLDQHEPNVEAVFSVLACVVSFARANYAVKQLAPLTSKCIHILQQISKLRLPSIEQASAEELENIFKALVDFQYKCANSEMQRALVAATGWLVTLAAQDKADFFRQTLDKLLKDFFKKANIELKANLFIKLIPMLYAVNDSSFFATKVYHLLQEYCFKRDIRHFKRCSAVEILSSILATTSHDISTLSNLASQSLTELIEELQCGKSKQPGSKELHLQYINLIIKLFIQIKGCQSGIQFVTLKKNLASKLDSTPKEFRKKLDKRFVRFIKDTD